MVACLLGMVFAGEMGFRLPVFALFYGIRQPENRSAILTDFVGGCAGGDGLGLGYCAGLCVKWRFRLLFGILGWNFCTNLKIK